CAAVIKKRGRGCECANRDRNSEKDCPAPDECLPSHRRTMISRSQVVSPRTGKSITKLRASETIFFAPSSPQILIDSFRFGVLQVSISQFFIVVMIGRKPNAFARLALVAGLMTVVSAAALAQKRGTINGTITPPTPSVVVVATNQVTGRVARAPVKSDGNYSLNIRPGAYRL